MTDGSYKERRKRLVQDLIDEGVIRSLAVEQAFNKVNREEFVWPSEREQAYLDTPLPLGYTGQTISAPHMVAIMLEQLDLSPDLKVLEVGCGSGYSAALTAEIIGKKGSVVSVERIPELVEFAKSNLERTGYSDCVTVTLGDGSLGYPPQSNKEMYDRIVVTAAAVHIPPFLKAQVKEGGIILVPVGAWLQTLQKVSKITATRFVTRNICGCIFVPLIEQEEQNTSSEKP